jgi:uncharacterized membrane protein
MKHYLFWLGNKYLDVYAETKEAAEKQALRYFTSILKDVLNITEVKERCTRCHCTYPPSEMVKRGNEQLCLSCDADTYPVLDEDIPF